MSNFVPPNIQPPKASVIGVGKREMIIFGVGGLLAIMCILIPVSVPIRIGLGVFVALTFVALALARDPRSGKTIETLLWNYLGFSSRSRYMRKGAHAEEESPVVERTTEAYEYDDTPSSPLETFETDPGGAVVTVKPWSLGLLLFGEIVSLAFLASLIAWIWVGGLEELMLYLPRSF